jgi:hypothetical protein
MTVRVSGTVEDPFAIPPPDPRPEKDPIARILSSTTSAW